MSKTIKIPEHMRPYEVIVNGVKYCYPAGEKVTVPDEVAAVIQRDIDSRAQETPEPVLIQPRWGSCKTPTKATLSTDFNSYDTPYVVMTEEQYAGLCADPDAIITNSFTDSDTEELVDLNLTKDDVRYENGCLYFDSAVVGLADYGYVSVTFTYAKETAVKIPVEYVEPFHCIVTFDVGVDTVVCDTSAEEILSAFGRGAIIVAIVNNNVDYTRSQRVGCSYMGYGEETTLTVGGYTYNFASGEWH